MIELAEILERYKSMDEIEALLLYGSRAMRMNSDDSDYDLYAVCTDSKPSTRIREHLNRPPVLEFKFDSGSSNWANEWISPGESFRLLGKNFDVGYQSKKLIQFVFHEVLEKGSLKTKAVSFRPYALVGIISTAQVLFDKTGIIQTLRDQSKVFPGSLKQNLIHQGKEIACETIEELCDFESKGVGNSAFLFILVRGMDALCEILFAINEMYDPCSKRVEEYFTLMHHKPQGLRKKFENILEGPYDHEGRKRTISMYKELYNDVLALSQ